MRDAVRQTLQTALLAAWATSPPCELVLSDAPMNQAKQPWARATIAFPDARAAAIGDTQRRGIAVITLQIFCPDKAGSKAATSAADRLDALAHQRIPVSGAPAGWTIHLESDGLTSGPTPAGPREGYTQHLARLSFRFDAHRTA